LEHHAAGGLLEVDDPTAGPLVRRYRLPPAHVPVLANPDNVCYRAFSGVEIVRGAVAAAAGGGVSHRRRAAAAAVGTGRPGRLQPGCVTQPAGNTIAARHYGGSTSAAPTAALLAGLTGVLCILVKMLLTASSSDS